MESMTLLTCGLCLLFSMNVNAQFFYQNEFYRDIPASSSFVYNFFSSNAISIYTVPYDPVTGGAGFNFSDPSMAASRGLVAQNIRVDHPLGYLIASSSVINVSFPNNYDLHYAYPATAKSSEVTSHQKLTVSTYGGSSPSRLVMVQDDFGNSFETAFPLQIGTDPTEFVEIFGTIDSYTDIDFFVLSVSDPASINSTYSVYVWTESVIGSPPEDTYCYLFYSDQTLIAINDDNPFVDGDVNCAVHVSHFKANTNYYFAVTSQHQPGNYVLRMSFVNPNNVGSFQLPITTSLAPSTIIQQAQTSVVQMTQLLFGQKTYDYITYSCAGNCPIRTKTRIVEQTCFPHSLCSGQRIYRTESCSEVCTPPTPTSTLISVTSVSSSVLTTLSKYSKFKEKTKAQDLSSSFGPLFTVSPVISQSDTGLGQGAYLIIGIAGAILAVLIVWVLFFLRPKKQGKLSDALTKTGTSAVSSTAMSGYPMMGGYPNMNMSVMGGYPNMNMSVMGGNPMQTYAVGTPIISASPTSDSQN